MNRKKCSAIVLAAGVGKRMQSDVPKQYMLLEEKPLLYYALKTFQESFVEEIILVTGRSEVEYCKKEIVEKYRLNKVKKIVPGGKERYHSVYEGLKAIRDCEYVYIHDGARPFVDNEMLERAYKAVEETGACVIGVKAKDTIKIADENGMVDYTPNRDLVWQVQTPQVFRYGAIKEAHEIVMAKENILITDDAMVYETAFGKSVKLVEGKYENIKITTPEDMGVAATFLKK
ncbi:MAG: 2-C-methyl-D-erythritol 4-phosphate cytidylyltransferase [Lachnospiraceae bacterium]|nr:2-C-methyl-D-erythritol 4-phosphate cytidylyltransferase [Lachnospiraceae bacterium]